MQEIVYRKIFGPEIDKNVRPLHPTACTRVVACNDPTFIRGTGRCMQRPYIIYSF